MTYYRQYAVWAPSEIARLQSMHDRGFSHKAMSSALSRTRAAVVSKLAQLYPAEPSLEAHMERHASLLRRLTVCHGPERAVRIVECRDPEANADLTAWNRLGSGRERAA